MRVWYETRNSRFKGEDPNVCPRCGAKTVEELDDNKKTSGYTCPKCGLSTDRN
jgi:predicted RNA-binding Zn-ribbon protein involved in translation (DUF1610 family)